MDLGLAWFCLVAFFWAGYFLLEGFDFGVGMLLPFLPQGEEDRQTMLRTIGPVWDGNEVWLVVAGGATFAAFPAWYATLVSGFYLPLPPVSLFHCGPPPFEGASLSEAGTGMSEIYLGNSANAATLTIKGGTVAARVMSFGNGGSNATLNLEGGTLIWNNAPTKSSGPANLKMGGGTLKAGGAFTVPSSRPFALTGSKGPLTV